MNSAGVPGKKYAAEEAGPGWAHRAFGPHREEWEAMGSSVNWRKALACKRHRPDWGQMANKETIAFRKSGMTDA